MDFQPLILQLGIRVREVDLAIVALERLQSGIGNSGGTVVANRRGRKSMSSEERQLMKGYWATKRKLRPTP